MTESKVSALWTKIWLWWHKSAFERSKRKNKNWCVRDAY